MQITPESIAQQYCRTTAEVTDLVYDICKMINAAYTEAAAVASEVKENHSGAMYLVAEDIEQQINALKIAI
jgi:hypothetical protein